MWTLRLLIAALSLALIAPSLIAPAARAQSTTIETALAQIPAAPELWGEQRFFEIVDLVAMREASGLPEGLRLDGIRDLPRNLQVQAQSMLWRIISVASFLQYIVKAGDRWEEWIGVDFMQLGWFAQAGNPPDYLLFLGGEAVPREDDLAVLANGGLEPQERGGTTVWVKGEKDNAIDPKGREPGYPFWGEIGSSVRVFRSEAALVGARAWPVIDLAIAVAAGEAESLYNLPRYRLAAEAAAARAFSAGPVLQIFFADEAFGEGVIGVPPNPVGLPPFGLLAVADRQDKRGQQAVLILTYEDEATAEEASQILLTAAEAYRDQHGRSLDELHPGLKMRAGAYKFDDGVVAALRLSTPPVPFLDENGKVAVRSILHRQIYQLLTRRALGFLATRE